MRNYSIYAFVMFVFALLGACSGGGGSSEASGSLPTNPNSNTGNNLPLPGQNSGPSLRLPLHFWVLTSDHRPNVSYDVSDRELQTYVERANLIWRPANIEFFIQETRRVEMSDAAAEAYEAWFTPAPGEPVDPDIRFAVLNSTDAYRPVENGFNIVLIKEVGIAPGVAQIGADTIFLSERLGADLRPHNIFAHELAHALGLRHVELDANECNLMKAGPCGTSAAEFTEDGLLYKTLLPCQIEIARGNAPNGFVKETDPLSASCVLADAFR